MSVLPRSFSNMSPPFQFCCQSASHPRLLSALLFPAPHTRRPRPTLSSVRWLDRAVWPQTWWDHPDPLPNHWCEELRLGLALLSWPPMSQVSQLQLPGSRATCTLTAHTIAPFCALLNRAPVPHLGTHAYHTPSVLYLFVCVSYGPNEGPSPGLGPSPPGRVRQ